MAGDADKRRELKSIKGEDKNKIFIVNSHSSTSYL